MENNFKRPGKSQIENLKTFWIVSQRTVSVLPRQNQLQKVVFNKQYVAVFEFKLAEEYFQVLEIYLSCLRVLTTSM